MTRHLPLFSLLFTSLILLSSCSHDYYVPSDAMLLGLSEKGDIKASANYGSNAGNGLTNRNYSIIAGYSPIKHLGLTANFFHFNNQMTTAFGRGQIGEIALGTYISKVKTKKVLKYSKNPAPTKDHVHDVAIKEKKRVTTFDIYTGYAYGNVFNRYTEGGLSNLTFERYFVQSAIHVNFNSRWKFSTGLKLLSINYQKGLLQGSINDHEMTLIKQIQHINPIPMWEWMGRMEVGWPHLRFHGGFTITSLQKNEALFSYVPMVISIGTTVDF